MSREVERVLPLLFEDQGPTSVLLPTNGTSLNNTADFSKSQVSSIKCIQC
jgi:hypothetical protein